MKHAKFTVTFLAVLNLALPTALFAADKQQIRDKEKLHVQDCDSPDCPQYQLSDDPNANPDPAMNQNRNRQQHEPDLCGQ